ncbi:MAG: aminopeptidase [Wenzhouxiangellaceae bacterium]|nr:aminopeptidase [Wenzhouxiangellaceae bacterium]
MLLCGWLMGIGGCATLAWYGQAVQGQMELMAKREDIEKILASDEPEPVERQKLELVLQARQFASDELALPDNDSYTRYVELDRDAVVYNVIATPEFSLEPKSWCYPIVGCLAYRGYFSRDAAERRAAKLAQQGFDVLVSPVAAYSTLGRFEDPVTSPMLDYGPTRLAGLIFHELAHQRVFVKGDTAFNEAFATAVERAGLERWLEARDQLQRLEAWRNVRATEIAWIDLLLDARDDLEALYAGELDAETMRRRKQQRFSELQVQYLAFRGRHDTTRFDGYMARALNNAHLALLATYEAGTESFAELLAEYGGDFERFHQAVERLASAEPEARAEFLNPCRTETCP